MTQAVHEAWIPAWLLVFWWVPASIWEAVCAAQPCYCCQNLSIEPGLIQPSSALKGSTCTRLYHLGWSVKAVQAMAFNEERFNRLCVQQLQLKIQYRYLWKKLLVRGAASCVSKAWSGGRRLVLSTWQAGNMLVKEYGCTSKFVWLDFLNWRAPTPCCKGSRSLLSTHASSKGRVKAWLSCPSLLCTPVWGTAGRELPLCRLRGDAFCGVGIMLFRQLPLPSSLTVEEPDKI